jgi:hypothetical protein
MSKRQVKKQAKKLMEKLGCYRHPNPPWADPHTITLSFSDGEVWVMGWRSAYRELRSIDTFNPDSAWNIPF